MNKKIVCYLIDDDADDQEIFVVALKELAVPVEYVTADNGIEALKKLKSDSSFVPDYIFIDLNMPRMSGRECLEELRKIPQLSGTSFIIYSTSSEHKDLTETRNLGADHFFTKPFSLSTLISRLSEFFEKKKNQVPVDYEI
jgi:CheY-like chemotaxis protein